jgi:thermospermine synthase
LRELAARAKMVGAVQEGIVREMNGGFEVMSGYDRSSMAPKQQQREEESKWYEEEIDDDLKLCYALNR